MQGTRQVILEYLQAHTEAAVAELAAAVDLAPVTVRHHLSVLKRRGLIEVQSEPVGRGRPRHVYRLSPAGGASLSGDGTTRLTSRVLDFVKANDGAAAERFFVEMAADLLADRRVAFDAAEGPEQRLDLLVETLAAEGLVARWSRDGAGYILKEISCPYSDLSERHAEVCCMDLALIRSVMGGDVQRECWRHDGDEACEFRILPLEPAVEPVAGGA